MGVLGERGFGSYLGVQGKALSFEEGIIELDHKWFTTMLCFLRWSLISFYKCYLVKHLITIWYFAGAVKEASVIHILSVC